MTATVAPPPPGSPPPEGPPPGGPPGSGGSLPTPPPPTAVGAPPPRPGPGLLPTRDEWWDLVMLTAMGMVGVAAFGPAFGGWWYLLVGGVGLALGGVLAWWAARRRLHPVWLALVGLVAYLVVGGPLVVPDRTIGVVVPTPSSVLALLEGAVRGWDNVLTTVAPIGRTSGLVVVVWLSSLVCGLVSVSIARRARAAGVLAVVGPAAVLVAGIITGTGAPAWTALGGGLQGVVLVVLAVVWGSVRQRTLRAAGMATRTGSRWAGSLVMLGVAGLLGLLVGSWGPFAGGAGRLEPRDTARPPVEEIDLTSPLEGFRRFETGSLSDQRLLTVRGLEPGERLRLVTLDRYDGESWRVERDGGAGIGAFRRLGESLETEVTADAEPRTIEVSLEGYTGPWIPTVYGPTRSLQYVGPNSSDLQEGIRVNAVTGSVAQISDDADSGASYRTSGLVPPTHRTTDPDRKIPDQVVGAGRPGPTPVPPADRVPVLDEVRLQYGRTTQGATELAQLLDVAERLGGKPTVFDDPNRPRQGFKSDGLEGQEPSSAGHSARRLTDMFDVSLNPYVVGNPEQYAAALAVLARQMGFPSRVVMGFAPVVPPGAASVQVVGSDATAWVEVDVEGVGWLPIFAADPTNTEPPPLPKQELRQPPDLVVAPPPPPPTTTIPIRSDAGANPCAVPDPPEECPDPPGSPLLPAWAGTVARIALPPVLLVVGITVLMGGLKARRRKRRRTRGSADARIAAGWSEVTDLARDLGDIVPDRSTRRETAVILARPGLADLARTADGLVFGPDRLDDAAAERYWQHVDVTRAAMKGPVGRFERWKALVNPTSLRRRTERGADAKLDPAALAESVRAKVAPRRPARPVAS